MRKQLSIIKSFWKSRNLFSKRFLAAGGKSDGGFRKAVGVDFFFRRFKMEIKKLKQGGLLR
jgi:hypothetical protein